ncbi:MAG: antitoxin HigA [Bradyrhizobium sp.]|nr:antitoxin HigA [Bradyrhizobium sp.]
MPTNNANTFDSKNGGHGAKSAFAHPTACFAKIDQPKAEIARLLGISRQHLHEILEEKKPVSPNVAARIGKLIGNGPAIWLRLQAAYDAWHAEREVDVSRIPTLEQV